MEFKRRFDNDACEAPAERYGIAPGKRTRSERLPAQREDAIRPAPATPPIVREAHFILTHPVIAHAIGRARHASTNISTNAARFATNRLGLKESQTHDGSEVNAMRHVVWQSQIAHTYGTGIATSAGDAHEKDPTAIDGDRRDIVEFGSLGEADQSVDLRNNEIGRAIGAAVDERTRMNDLAAIALEHFHAEGLWVAEPTAAGTWRVVRRKLADAVYEDAKARLQQLDENGFDEAQRRGR